MANKKGTNFICIHRSAISIKTREDIEQKFLKLLDELEFKYTINATTKLNNILSGE